MMNVTSTVLGDTLIAKLDGRVDAGSCKSLEEQATGWIESGKTRLVFDCESMEYVSSAGLRVFLLVAKRVGRRGVPSSCVRCLPQCGKFSISAASASCSRSYPR